MHHARDGHFILLFFFIAVPSEAPISFNVIVQTSTSVTASWQPPPAHARNGRIGFKLFYQKKEDSKDSPTVLTFTSSSTLATILSGLNEFTKYEFQVLAFTSVGDGPKSSASVVTTKEDGRGLEMALVGPSLLGTGTLYLLK